MSRYFPASVMFLVITSVVVSIAGCGDPATDASIRSNTGGRTVDEAATGISWYSGTVDEAFAEAKKDNKPLYLYWGAEWCPPCHAINATVFQNKAFIDRSRSFIAVYLDGDLPDAQAAGESFGVVGYPTMIVFDPSGKELTRIPGGIDILAYASVLDLVLDDVAPAAAIMERVVEGGESLDASDCRLLAYYSWGQDRTILAEHDAASVFAALESACPDDQVVEKSILFLAQLSHRLDAAAGDDDPQPLSVAEKNRAFSRVNSILDEYALVKANVFDVAFAGAEITAALTDPETDDRAFLQRKFLAALDRLFDDDTVYLRERLYTLVGKIDFQRIDDEDAELSSELKDEIRAKIRWADDTTTISYERHPIINAAANILDDAGMNDVAKPLLLKEIEVAKQPYYFMVTLADFEQEAGNYEAAISWLEQAYAATSGPATRFQWGYYYVSGLIEMTPEDAAAIENATVELIREIEGSGGFYQRPKAQLKRLESKLREWSDDESVLRAIRDQICFEADERQPSESACDTFLLAS